MSQSLEILSLSSDESNDSDNSNDSEEFDIRVEQGWTDESVSSSEEDDSVQSNYEHEITDINSSNENSQEDALIENSGIDFDQWIRSMSNNGSSFYDNLYETMQFNGKYHWQDSKFSIKYHTTTSIDQTTNQGKAIFDSLNNIFGYIDTDSEFLINRVSIVNNYGIKLNTEFIVHYNWNLTKLKKFLAEDVHVNDLKRCITGATLKVANEAEISSKSVISLRDIRDFFTDSLVDDPIWKQNEKDHYKLQRKNKI